MSMGSLHAHPAPSRHGGFNKAARRTTFTPYEAQAVETERKAQLLAFERSPPMDEVDRIMMVGVGPAPVGSGAWRGTTLREHFHRMTMFGGEIEASFRMNMPLFGNVVFKKA
jgi:hypothetical protein